MSEIGGDTDLREQIETVLNRSCDACARCKTRDRQVDAVLAVVEPALTQLREENARKDRDIARKDREIARLGESMRRQQTRADLAESRAVHADKALRRHGLMTPDTTKEEG